MTPSETTALIDKHLEGWVGACAGTPTLRDRIAAMIAEAIAGRDKLFADGQETMRHEWNQARAQLANEQKLHDEIVANQATEIHRLLCRPDNAIFERMRVKCITLESDLAHMTQARDDAVQAAHLIAEELAECKRRVAL